MSGGSKAVTIGYRYYMGLHMAACYGPVDALLEIRAGDRTAWTGNQSTSGAITVTAPSLFGGDEREGGLEGGADVMMGEASQGANAYLASVQSGLQPAYRGIFSLVWKGGLVASMNPYIKPWAFRLRRHSAGWRTAVFDPGRASVTLASGLQGMNPAHILYQCITDPEWGMGYPVGSINAASWLAASSTFHAEGLGLCLQWAASEPSETFVQRVCDHAGAVWGVDRRTGEFLLTPIRSDYSVPALPLFNEDNIGEVQTFQRRALPETVNEITVVYRDQLTNKDASVTAHDLANITAQGAVVSQTKQYPGIATAALASRLALRDLQTGAAMLAKVRFTTNRSAYALRPGSVIRWSWPKLGIVDMALRIGRIDYGSLTAGRITIEAVEDVFGLPTTTYIAQQAGGWTPPSTSPVAPPAVLTVEAPYREVVRLTDPANFGLYTSDDCFVAGLASRPTTTVALGYEFETRVGSADYALRELAPFATYGTTSAALSRTATSGTLAAGTDLQLLAVGAVALLGTECVRIEAIAGLVLTIARGCLDTVPQAHAAGAVLWGFQDVSADDLTTYANGETVNGRYRTVATGGTLATGSAPVASVTTSRRFGRPYPPGDLQFNALRYPATITGALTVSWKHRDRVLQADTVVDTLAASIGPEAGVTYTLELYDQGNVLRRTYTGLTGTSQAWTTELADSGLAVLNTSVRARLWAVRGGLTSWQVYDFTVSR